MNRLLVGAIMVGGVMIVGAAAFALWISADGVPDLEERVPGQTVRPPDANGGAAAEPANPGTLVEGDGNPSALAGSWPGFRGPNRDNIAAAEAGLLRAWPPEGPREVWRIPVGEGHAGPVIHRGRVYLVDYDREKREDAIRCLSLDDGAEIWRYTYSVSVKRNHGMSRTVPAVNDKFVVAMGPKCHVTCVDAATGDLVWKMDLPKEYKTTVPPWYAGQCPLIEGDAVILAPGGDPLMMAVELATGNILWRTPNTGRHGMTHSSIMPVEIPGVGRQYLYCTTRGVIGVADDGKGSLLWMYPDWRISIANIPSPLVIDGERIFFSGGYAKGSEMVRLTGEGTAVTRLFRLPPEVFGSDQHTPILYEGHIYGVLPKPSREAVCLDLDGKQVWTSGAQHRFGEALGPYLLADGMLFVLNDMEGTLHLVSATPDGYHELASAKILNGHDAWAPMALASGRLILRDLTELVCLDVKGPEL